MGWVVKKVGKYGAILGNDDEQRANWLDKGKGRPYLGKIRLRMVNKGKTHKKLARKSINHPSSRLGKIQTRLGLVQFWARMMNKGKMGWTSERVGHIWCKFGQGW